MALGAGYFPGVKRPGSDVDYQPYLALKLKKEYNSGMNFTFTWVKVKVGSCTTQSELLHVAAVNFVNYTNRVVVWLEIL